MNSQSFSPRLGARNLQEEEIKLSLPTYPKFLEQIEVIRQNAAAVKKQENNKAPNKKDAKNAFTRLQVTNNLSILGVRGSGKTSVLKTLYESLKAANGKDDKTCKNILLPPVVPENLDSHMTLMSSLLGLLREQVKQYTEKRQSEYPMCLTTKNQLEKDYRQLVEYFVHLQKPYQDISVQKYSTESDYVRTMSEVFEAGNQFDVV